MRQGAICFTTFQTYSFEGKNTPRTYLYSPKWKHLEGKNHKVFVVQLNIKVLHVFMVH